MERSGSCWPRCWCWSAAREGGGRRLAAPWRWTWSPLIGRARPCVVYPAVELLIPPPLDASFPSGHTAASFAAVFALKASGSPLWKPALVLAATIAFSRLYLYVHWPSDVLGGILLGAACGWAGARLVEKAGDHWNRKAGR